jgi:hypothetical protein
MVEPAGPPPTPKTSQSGMITLTRFMLDYVSPLKKDEAMLLYVQPGRSAIVA